ncbi:3-hydroxyacyl-CoA dehydrogenase family protein [Candidatus Palauibacter sp.]|uniref:3-hydroxyacyl-CoA dehydrogenase family protein n=1 Tax=Candidatus Palauibacter sp. TaxID=3101350 RepID=UPI003B51E996
MSDPLAGIRVHQTRAAAQETGAGHVTVDPIRRAAVVGAGLMGAGIAQVLALGGLEVAMNDLGEEALDRAAKRIEHGRFGIRKGVEIGKVDAAVAEGALGRLSGTTDLSEAVADADLVIEAVYEDFQLKTRLFRRLDAAAPPHAILASNSSGFSIGAFAGATDRPERVIGWHWATPASVIRVAEIVVHRGTADAVRDAVVALARRCGKNPEVVQDQPLAWGFVANRVFTAALREAREIVAEGVATPEQVDRLMKDCYRWPAGPFEMVAAVDSGWEE